MASILTDVGEAEFVDRIDGTVTDYTDFVAWGTGAGTAAKADTTLFTEASEARVAATHSQPAADTARWVGTITANGTKTITNVGILTASAAGVLIVHADHTGVPLLINESIQYTVDVQIT